ncbi:DNA topoisomerase IB [Oleisolibacter albus]|uniref:DNA topoisomerase IB n=1 Tax=Oleisolibacter albus TaxID=2171757 RepID=UPI001EFCB6EA|nr:DNA topoisomerase IB [Oleisolibacter albus]
MDGGISGQEMMAQAAAVDLRYVNDDEPGIRRRRTGRGFRYIGPDGAAVKDPADLARIRRLAIPPAYTDVWICADAQGHIQATGRDARGRKQYRYHPRWVEVRDADKYERLLAFSRALPLIRARIEADLHRPGLPREKVLACVVKLLDTTLIRIGNDSYAKENRSFGLTTLRDRHVQVQGRVMRFQFRGKSGKDWRLTLHDRRLARLVKACQDVPGQRLFQYVDTEGGRHGISSQDVNAYIRDCAGQDFSAKDFRTWAGTVLAAFALQELEQVDSQAARKRNLTAAIRKVASRLGNTPAVCRRCYVHPQLMSAYLEEGLIGQVQAEVRRALRPDLAGLSPEEAAVLAFLERRLQREAG